MDLISNECCRDHVIIYTWDMRNVTPPLLALCKWHTCWRWARYREDVNVPLQRYTYPISSEGITQVCLNPFSSCFSIIVKGKSGFLTHDVHFSDPQLIPSQHYMCLLLLYTVMPWLLLGLCHSQARTSICSFCKSSHSVSSLHNIQTTAFISSTPV